MDDKNVQTEEAFDKIIKRIEESLQKKIDANIEKNRQRVKRLEKKSIKDFLLKGNNDIYEGAKQMDRRDLAYFKKKVEFALFNGPLSERNYYNRYVAPSLVLFINNEENLKVIALLLTEHDPSFVREEAIEAYGKFKKFKEAINKEINEGIVEKNKRVNLGMNVFFKELRIMLLKNDEYIDKIAKYLDVTNRKVEILIAVNEIHRVMTEAIDHCNFCISQDILGKYKMWKMKNVEEVLIKYLEGGDTYTDEKKWQCYSGGDLAHIFNHSKKAIEKTARLYPEAEHWTIDVFRKYANNNRFIKLKRGVFSLEFR
ncbi:hypothetical protein [Enterococcus villorum]|uniref:Uncharacterized protein n=2 Tax=Enterococcus villorum TaxID=112904 RepID=A0A511IZU4_9ENTE|nr:hypothetical protein [Enterococcus villorum]EOH89966.1 hypothetical protein UAO_01210 [Enterococcus villorum ATCC 700913]EOW78198.1 hypothetical protein I591_01053 [Enterococcus villorum ATCC 700913]GEL90913.1 hypothetical protein EVI01_02500 [Enterococcus villorum]